MTDCTGCRFTNNTIDVGLDGSLGASFDAFTLNTFGSGSITSVIDIGLGD
jgi:hypothetical protein